MNKMKETLEAMNTITVYNTDSYNKDLISDVAPFEAEVLFVNDEEYLVKSIATGHEYWLYADCFDSKTSQSCGTETYGSKRETVEEATNWQQEQAKKMQQEELEKELNRFFLYFRENGERFIGISIEQFVKKYLEGK
jgi:hypothetical protein